MNETSFDPSNPGSPDMQTTDNDQTLLSPWDAHNQNLVAHVHPADWKNPKPESAYNLVVIGAGTAGLGAEVALIERHLMGGDCLNVGCVPSKAVIRASRVATAVRNAGEFGAQIPHGVPIDFARAMERMRRLRAFIAPNDSVKRFTDMGVDVFIGEGRFVDTHSVEVAGERLAFRKAVIATGARAAAPPIDGLDKVSYLTNETVFSLTELPKRLAVGGSKSTPSRGR
jgi:pyruvate/2-oxoglutarate dehydrogenase complex dihydrolipoamide dehydrogenase (E3) component